MQLSCIQIPFCPVTVSHALEGSPVRRSSFVDDLLIGDLALSSQTSARGPANSPPTPHRISSARRSVHRARAGRVTKRFLRTGARQLGLDTTSLLIGLVAPARPCPGQRGSRQLGSW